MIPINTYNKLHKSVILRPVQLMIELLQHGCVSSADSQEAAQAMDLAKHLQVPGTFSLVKETYLIHNHFGLSNVFGIFVNYFCLFKIFGF